MMAIECRVDSHPLIHHSDEAFNTAAMNMWLFWMVRTFK